MDDSVSSSRSAQLALLGGAAFAVLLMSGLLMQAVATGGAEEESRNEVVARYSDGGNELLVEVGALLIGLGVAFALPFLASLHRVLRSIEGDRSVLPTAAVAGGVVMLVMLCAASVATVAAFSSYDFYEAYQVDPDVVLLMQSVSFSALGYALVGGSVFVASTSIAAFETRVMPRWMGVGGLVLAAVCLFGEWALMLFLPLPLLLTWTAVASALLLVSERRTRR